MTLSIFQALPPYFGSKRRLLGEIFKMLSAPHEATVFVDAFLGGGSVSLFAKARGYRVLCNDIAERSHIIGKALIKNEKVKVTKDDIMRLFKENEAAGSFIQDKYCPDVFVRAHGRFLDLALANAREFQGMKQWLMKLLLIKYIFRIRPHGNFGAKTIVHQLEEGNWEEMNPHYVSQNLNRRINSHPVRIARALAREINKGVFSNGKRNECYQLDAFDFLSQVEADIAYFDPPYAGTQSYESSLKVVDTILAGKEIHPQRSVFSGKGAKDALELMFDAAKHISTWFLSYGNAVIGLDELVALMKKFKRNVKAKEIQYAHCHGLASEESRKRNREYIFVGTNR